MTPERWDRIKCTGTIAALMLFGTLQACNKDPKASADYFQSARQNAVDKASIVCRDGTEYLIGGSFSAPYYRNGVLMTCGPNNNQPASAKKEV